MNRYILDALKHRKAFVPFLCHLQVPGLFNSFVNWIKKKRRSSKHQLHNSKHDTNQRQLNSSNNEHILIALQQIVEESENDNRSSLRSLLTSRNASCIDDDANTLERVFYQFYMHKSVFIDQ